MLQDSGYDQKVALTGFIDGLDVGCKIKKDVKDDSKV